MTSTPRISVIIPIFKTEKYLYKCITSVLRQSFRDIEVLCIDDCSPDGSIEIAEELAESDSRVRIIRHEKNLGLGGSRNSGIRFAKAEYIASVDSDDYIEERMLEDLYNSTENGRYDVVVCGYDRVDEMGAVLSKHLRKKMVIDPIPKHTDPFTISNPAFWNKLWRRSLYVENNIYFPNHIYYQDAATTPKIYSVSRNIRFIGGGYYKYLNRSDSVTNTISDKHLVDKLREIDSLKNYFEKREDYNDYSAFIDRRIFDTFRQLWLTIKESANGPDEDTVAYLRHMLIMRSGLMKSDDSIRRLGLSELAKAFEVPNYDIERTARARKGTCGISYVDEEHDFVAIKKSDFLNDGIREKLSFKVYFLLASLFMTKSHKENLIKNPAKAFRGARRPITRLGRWLYRKYI